MAEPMTDSVLGGFLETIEKLGSDKFSFGLTLLVDGTLVSGMPISAREYLAGLGEQFTEATRQATGDETDAWQELFTEMAKTSQEGLDKRDAELEQITDEIQGGKPTPEQKERLAELERQVIHLKNVGILKPDGRLIRMPLWRVRMSKVGGWSFGELSESR